MTSRYSHPARRRRKSNTSRNAIVLLLAVAAILFAAEIFLQRDKKERIEALEGDLTWIATPDGITEEIVEYKGMRVSFNPDLHIPNWVAWELTEDETDGSAKRNDTFTTDGRIAGCATTDDYKNSGYDRGHMAPAGDMKWDQQAMDESFSLVNIAPQAGSLNRGSWKKIEEKCRARVTPTRKSRMDSAIVIICGPVPNEEPAGRIGQTGVAVPRRFFKVILAPYAPEPYAIGFVMPNGDTPGGMQRYAMSVDDVEKITGYDFFAALPDSLENELESRFNFNRWSRRQ